MRYRLAAVFAGLALVVALLAGSAGGVPFATVLVRALAGAVVFGGLGLATVTVLQRFLPELFAGAQPAEAPSAQPATPAVDIILPEENPLAGEFEEAPEAAEDAVPVEPESAGSGAPDSPQVPGEPPAAEAEVVREAAAGSAADDVESLPSFDGLDVEQPESPAAGRSPRRRSGATDAADMNTDPTLAARALRTWLKRDHEG